MPWRDLETDEAHTKHHERQGFNLRGVVAPQYRKASPLQNTGEAMSILKNEVLNLTVRILRKLHKGTAVSESYDELVIADVAQQQWTDFKQRHMPFQNKVISDVMRDQSAIKNMAAGRTAADIQQVNAEAPVGNVANGNFTSNSASKKGGMLSSGIVTARQGIDDSNLRTKQALVDMGRGQATEAQAGLESVAGAATRSAISKSNNDWQRAVSTAQNGSELVGSVVGGASAYAGLKAKTPAKTPGLQPGMADIINDAER
jgi:hypothetical protein